MSRIFKNNQPENSNSNKISVLLKYAIIEIFLVVIGILIALQINNWNENRLLNIQKEENLINLKSAIQKDINLLKTIESFNDFRFNSLSQVLKWSNNSIANLESLRLILKDSADEVKFANSNDYDPSIANDLLERSVYEITGESSWDFKAIYE